MEFSCLDGSIMQEKQHNTGHLSSFSLLRLLRQQVQGFVKWHRVVWSVCKSGFFFSHSFYVSFPFFKFKILACTAHTIYYLFTVLLYWNWNWGFCIVKCQGLGLHSWKKELPRAGYTIADKNSLASGKWQYEVKQKSLSGQIQHLCDFFWVWLNIALNL